MEMFFQGALFSEETINILHPDLGPWLDQAMKIISMMGAELFFICIFSIVYWCWDKKTGIKLGIVLLVSAAVNDIAKEIFTSPRPDTAKLAHEIKSLRDSSHVGGYGFPSGHTQNTFSFWLSSIYYLRSMPVIITGIIMMLIVPFSRIYLGVHYPGDLAGGAILSMMIIPVLAAALYFIEKNMQKKWSVVIPCLAILVPVLVFNFLPGYHLNMVMGMLSGISIGHLTAGGRFNFEPRGSVGFAVAKTLIGISGLAAILFGLTEALAGTILNGFIINWLMGFWITFLAPYIFVKISVKISADSNTI
ncbi:MAG: phosphatase PAP2 family protein [Spirochaetes bacterium]|jgi:membrane-associated phospholipid phosphatase|nr:phosphatase PAP2 family protein [Spirochaetota bacterium]